MNAPYARYDEEADCLYVRLRDGEIARTHALDDLRLIDYSDDHAVLGVEFISASGGIDLTDVPFARTVEKLIYDYGLSIPILAA